MVGPALAAFVAVLVAVVAAFFIISFLHLLLLYRHSLVQLTYSLLDDGLSGTTRSAGEVY